VVGRNIWKDAFDEDKWLELRGVIITVRGLKYIAYNDLKQG
jgi:hypothetical protein